MTDNPDLILPSMRDATAAMIPNTIFPIALCRFASWFRLKDRKTKVLPPRCAVRTEELVWWGQIYAVRQVMGGDKKKGFFFLPSLLSSYLPRGGGRAAEGEGMSRMIDRE